MLRNESAVVLAHFRRVLTDDDRIHGRSLLRAGADREHFLDHDLNLRLRQGGRVTHMVARIRDSHLGRSGSALRTI